MNNEHEGEFITIGKYYIEWDDHGGLWIEVDGGGGQFKESELEKIIEKFYTENL